MRSMFLISAIAVLGASCTDPALEKRVTELEAKVEANASAAKSKGTAAPSPADDQAAGQLLRAAHDDATQRTARQMNEKQRRQLVEQHDGQTQQM